MLCKFTIVLIVLGPVYMRTVWFRFCCSVVVGSCLHETGMKKCSDQSEIIPAAEPKRVLQTGRFSSCKHKLTSLTCSHMLIMLYDGKTFARSFILVSCKHSNNCSFYAVLTSCWSQVNTAPDNCKFPIKVKLLAPLSMQFAKCCIQNDYLCPI